MVFFVCEGCNETLKKNKVDAHAGRCRNCWAVSCVDCSVVFEGNDYAAHTSCISEAEKYEGSLFQGDKSKKGKKQTPQERWMEAVQSATCPEDRKVQDALTRIAGYDNVPRKKNKFVNFVSNSIALRDNAVVERIWTIYETAFNASAPESNPKPAEEASKKRNAEPEAEDSAASKKARTEEKPVKWSKLITSALKSAGKELDMDKLRDQVLQQIKEKELSSKSEKDLKKEFKAAIKESDKFTVVEVVRVQ